MKVRFSHLHISAGWAGWPQRCAGCWKRAPDVSRGRLPRLFTFNRRGSGRHFSCQRGEERRCADCPQPRLKMDGHNSEWTSSYSFQNLDSVINFSFVWATFVWVAFLMSVCPTKGQRAAKDVDEATITHSSLLHCMKHQVKAVALQNACIIYLFFCQQKKATCD